MEQSIPVHPGKHLQVFLEQSPPFKQGLHEVVLLHLNSALSLQSQVVTGGHTSPGSQFNSQISKL